MLWYFKEDVNILREILKISIQNYFDEIPFIVLMTYSKSSFTILLWSGMDIEKSLAAFAPGKSSALILYFSL